MARKKVYGPSFFAEDIDLYRKQAIQAAKELWYETGVVEKLKAAKTTEEINRILVGARKGE